MSKMLVAAHWPNHYSSRCLEIGDDGHIKINDFVGYVPSDVPVVDMSEFNRLIGQREDLQEVRLFVKR